MVYVANDPFKQQKFYELLEKGCIILLFSLVYFAVIYHPEDPVFIGQFNNKDGSIYVTRAVDVLVSVVLFFTVAFRLIPRQLLKSRYLVFISCSMIMLGVVSAAEYGLDRLTLHFFNLPVGSNEISDKMMNFPRRDLYYSTIIPGNSMVYVLAFLYGLSRDWITKARRESELQKQNMRASIDFLRSQINPHFFFNALNNIYAITRRNKDQEAGDAIMKLSAVMRYMIYDSDVDLISLDKEVEHIKQYIDLVRLKFDKNDPLDIQFSVKGKTGNYQIAPLILLPFIENSCKHGLTATGSGFVHIELSVEDGNLLFAVENSKAGIQDLYRKHPGIGLENVKSRLELLYPEMHLLSIEDSENNYKIQLKINFKES